MIKEEEKLNVCEAVEHYGFTDTFVNSKSFEDINDSKFQTLVRNFIEAHNALTDYIGYEEYLKKVFFSIEQND